MAGKARKRIGSRNTQKDDAAAKQGPSQYEKIKQITEQMEQSIQNFMSDPNGAYQQWLSVLGRFHNYSLNNTILIATQKPEASLVAGFNTWKQLGRSPVKGSHAIKILAPAPWKQKVEMDKLDPNTQRPVIGADGKPEKETKEILHPAFKVVNVFDVSDTEGKDLPQIGVNELTGSIDQYEIVFEAIKRICPVPIGFENIEGGAKGYYHLTEKRIAIQEGMSQAQTVKTALHEAVHQKLHSITDKKDLPEGSPILTRNHKEIEAESCAFAILKYLNITDTSDYSFAYLASWSRDKTTPELKDSMDRIRKASSEMINALSEQIEIIRGEKAAEVSRGENATEPKPSVIVKLKEAKEEAKEKQSKAERPAPEKRPAREEAI